MKRVVIALLVVVSCVQAAKAKKEYTQAQQRLAAGILLSRAQDIKRMSKIVAINRCTLDERMSQIPSEIKKWELHDELQQEEFALAQQKEIFKQHYLKLRETSFKNRSLDKAFSKMFSDLQQVRQDSQSFHQVPGTSLMETK